MVYEIINRDCIEWMSEYEHDCDFDAIITDPPYGIGIFNEDWDTFETNEYYMEFTRVWAREALRLVKPGAHCFAFGGPKTFAYMQVAFEQVGWETRDILMWCYSTGFPKSKRIHGQDADGNPYAWQTALKPAYEPVLMARAPMNTSVTKNFAEHGTGVLDIEAARVDGDRHPSNVIMDTETASLLGDVPPFYYHAKASNAEREAGLDDFADTLISDGRQKHVDNPRNRMRERKNYHTALKPIDVMRWLVRLANGKRILDPFMGSGTTLIAAELEGIDSVGIERQGDFCDIAAARIDHWKQLSET